MTADPLDPAAAARLRSAMRHLRRRELGKASQELEAMPRSHDETAAMLAARFELHVLQCEWLPAANCARQMTVAYPVIEAGWLGLALALRQLDRATEARSVLLQAEMYFTCSALVQYGLACCEARLGNRVNAEARLATAILRNASLALDAATDVELRPLPISAP